MGLYAQLVWIVPNGLIELASSKTRDKERINVSGSLDMDSRAGIKGRLPNLDIPRITYTQQCILPANKEG